MTEAVDFKLFSRRAAGLAGAAAAIFAVLWPGSARAHPHAWVDATPTLILDRDRIVSVRQVWHLDPFISELIMADFDADGDGDLGPEEAEEIARTAFAGMEEYAFFTHARIDGTPIEWQGVASFRSWLEGDQIVYDFVLDLPRPVDPAAESLAIGFYDETYYVDVAVADDEVGFEGDDAGSCAASLAPDPETTIYFGLVQPLIASVTCGVADAS